MTPPPVTPSPHRFLAKPQHKKLAPPTPANTPKPKAPKPRPKHHETPAPLPDSNTRTDPRQQQPRPTSSSSQFAPTPRFSFAAPRPPAKRPRPHPAVGDDESLSTPARRRFVVTGNNERIEQDEDEDGATSTSKRPSFISHDQTLACPSQAEDQILPSSPLPHRPVFLAPTGPATAVSIAPLPEAFSPHRRGEKFIPGGMAATAREWILGAANTSQPVGGRRGVHRDAEGWRVKVLECVGTVGEGVVLVRGQLQDGAEAGRMIKMVLPGAGKSGRGMDGGVVVGRAVRVSAPTWDIVLGDEGSKDGGEQWVVAVDWQVVRDDR